jgi:Transcriptional regulators
MTKRSLSQKVEKKIIRLLSEGHLKVGDRLPPERELAEAMNVSRHTLRAAVKALELKGILIIRPGSGIFVFGDHEMVMANNGNGAGMLSEIPSMTDIFQFRWAIEPAIVAYATNNATSSGLKEVKDNLELQLQAIADDDHDLWARTDVEFHLLLPQLSGNAIFINMMNQLTHCLAICVDASHLNPARMKMYYDGHLGIYESIRTHNAKKALFYIEDHLKHLPWQENLRVSSVVQI